MKQQCSVCHDVFSCGANSETCWCSSFPAIMPLDLAQACRCPTCLAIAINKQIDQAIAQQGYDKVVAVASQYQKQALMEGIDYTTEDGNMV